MINWLHASYFETPLEEIKYLKQSLEMDDQKPLQYFILGNIYNGLFQYDKAIPEYEKALEVTNKWGVKPMWILNYTQLGFAYHETGQYKKEKKIYIKAEQEFPGDYALLRRQSILSLTEGDEVAANRYIDRYISVRKGNSVAEATIMARVADIYSAAGIPDKAEEYFRHALSLEPENPLMLNNFAWFLIDNDRNINEGLELIEKALKLSPDIDYMLDTKGWGLYKQGNYKEALEILQKSWDLRSVYDYEVYLHLEEAKKAVASQKK
jgi:Tfp pilus assembly protein PilF